MDSKRVRAVVRKFLKESVSEKHLCLDGNLVPVESQECYDDVCRRIEDAKSTRNLCSMRSDSRDHWNGVLKVLRRKHRKSKRFVDSLEHN